MSDKIIVALISIGGSLLSALLAFFVSKWQTKEQLKKVILELEHKYSEKLFDKRLEVYPELYHILSVFDKKLTKNELTPVFINETYKKIMDWDSKNALYVSHQLIELLVEIRKLFTENLNNLSVDELKNDALKKEVFNKVISLERSLKYEIGAYSSKDFNISPQIFDKLKNKKEWRGN